MTTYAFGDIHGCLEQLEKLVDRCLNETTGTSTTFVFLGDYIDRGPNSKGVVQFLMDLQTRERRVKLICLVGNHEACAIKVASGVLPNHHWTGIGGAATLHSYGVDRADQIPKLHLQWMTSLPAHFDDGLRLFVHAGIRPDRPIDRQQLDDLVWIREPFLSSEVYHGRLVVHGHTPTHDRLPDLRHNRLNLDTGAVYGGPLTAAVFNSSEVQPIRFLSQPGSDAARGLTADGNHKDLG